MGKRNPWRRERKKKRASRVCENRSFGHMNYTGPRRFTAEKFWQELPTKEECFSGLGYDKKLSLEKQVLMLESLIRNPFVTSDLIDFLCIKVCRTTQRVGMFADSYPLVNRARADLKRFKLIRHALRNYLRTARLQLKQEQEFQKAM